MFVSHANSPGPGKMKFKKPNILRKKPKCTDKVNPSECGDSVTLSNPNLSPILKASEGPSSALKDNVKPIVIKRHHKIKLDSYECETNRNSEKTSVDNAVAVEDTPSTECINNNGYVTLTLQSALQSDQEAERENITYVSLPMDAVLLHGDTFLIPTPNPVLTTSTEDTASLDVTDSVSFKCDFEDCTKEFNSKQKLKKHKARHNKDPSKIIKQPIPCPARKPKDNGEIEAVPCDRVFDVKEDLVNHLKTDHTLDDAAYSCPECLRRFFWASGVRAHRRACGADAPRRPALACPWEGCGRSFRQPCRLKEHCRAHTGDRPYPCLFPGCGWAFRTASKLLRHQRKHTGERRHKCGDCGAQFLRREHLREHAARHAPALARPARPPRPPRRHARNKCACTVQGCKQKFGDEQSLDEHVKTAHLVSPSEVSQMEPPKPLEPDHIECDWGMEEDPFLAGLGMERVECGRAARTHCTWPLAARPIAAETVELSEGSESNASTIRSDLFLHGNVLINEDNESNGGRTLLTHDMDALGLLQDHNTDLMQDALLYTDSAVDESSFQVLLLNDEVLNS